MRLKTVGAGIAATLMFTCPVLAFSEPVDLDDTVSDADETIAANTSASDSGSNDAVWLSASKDTST